MGRIMGHRQECVLAILIYIHVSICTQGAAHKLHYYSLEATALILEPVYPLRRLERCIWLSIELVDSGCLRKHDVFP
jgi:hypothetical protein